MRRSDQRTIGALLLASALSGGAALKCSAAETSFVEQVVPLLNSHCLVCHLPGAAQGSLSLYPDPYASLVGPASTQAPMPLVAPGDPKGSYLYRKMDGTHLEAGGNGDHMPFQRDLLAPADLAVFRSWIEQGAKNN